VFDFIIRSFLKRGYGGENRGREVDRGSMTAYILKLEYVSNHEYREVVMASL